MKDKLGARVLRGESTTPPPKAKTATTRATALWTVVMGLGIAFTLIGSLELVFGWVGVDLSNRNMFFEAVNHHVNQLVIPTIGLGAVAVGFMGRGSRRYVSAMAWVFWAVAALHLFLIVFYFSRVPQNLEEPAIALRSMVRGLIYVGAYAWTAYYLWAQTRVQSWPSRPG
jgi:hypothetical protein